MVSSALPPAAAAASPLTSQAKKGKAVSSFVKSKSSSIVKQAGKSFRGVGSSLSERRISMPASIGRRGKEDEEVESRDAGGGGGSGIMNEGRAAPQSSDAAAVDERECTDGGVEQKQSRETAAAETSNDLLGDAALLLVMPSLGVPPSTTPPTTSLPLHSSEGGRRRKLLKKAKSLPKKLQVASGHRSSQPGMASPEVTSSLARLSVGGSSPRPLSSPMMTSAHSQICASAAAANASSSGAGASINTTSTSIIVHSANASAATATATAAEASTIASSNNPSSTHASRDEAPRVTVIEPLPLAPPEILRRTRSNSVNAGSGGIGFGSFLPAAPGGTSGLTTSKRSGAEKLFRSLRGKDELAEAAAAVGLDKDIGLKLALPDKLDIMCGRATPPPPGSTAASGQDGTGKTDGRDDQEDPYANPFACSTPNSSPRKKILIVPGSQDDRDAPSRTPLSAIRKKLTIPTLANLAAGAPTGASPAASSGAGGMDDRSVHSASSRGSRGSRRSCTHSRDGSLSIAKPTDDRPVQAASDPVMDEIVIRTSELEPSVHQITLPAATDLLLCARVCSLLEGYDRLLRHQAAKGRRWFDFAELVGAERHELEEAYLHALGHHKEADEQAKRQAIAGSIARMGASTSIQVPSSSGSNGNPFGAGATVAAPGTATPTTGVSTSTNMEEISLLGDTVTGEGSRFSDPKNLPHPSILKSLLDCGDDIKVEGYFTETLGEEDEGLSIPALEHGERTIFPEDYGEKSSAVTVAVFSSQQHRQFIVCYKGTAEQQAKPVKSHVRQKDANGGEVCLFK